MYRLCSKWVFGLPLLFLLTNCQPSLPVEVETAYQQLPDHVDFNFDVKPILSDKCFACHGPDEGKREADLRLDMAEHALESTTDEGIPIIDPSAISNSELVRRILSEDAQSIMPPPESHLALSPSEKATLIKWIDQGANYKPHWSFIKPVKQSVPTSYPFDWGNNPIDYFVGRKLEQQNLEPTPTASKESLIRRLYFDLTGLPPALYEIDAFLTDESPQAYEKMVDRLLASPAYGERMAIDWMDVARYADSDGYLDDKHRSFSPWRDWVIEAFNSNMPYDEFVSWQLAGDLLPNKTQESVLATAFNRLHRRNSEAGIVFEEFRVEHVADRTATLGKAFLGLTLACARCHDHKYDPISQEQYYQLFGFFNSTAEMGTAVYGPDQTPGPALLLTNQEQARIKAFLEQEIQKQEKELNKIDISKAQDFQQWKQSSLNIKAELTQLQSFKQTAHYPFDQFSRKSANIFQSKGKKGKPIEIKEPIVRKGKKGKALFLGPYTKLKLPQKVGWFERHEPFSISLAIYPDTLYDKEVGIFYHCEDLRLGLKGYSLSLDQNRLNFIISHSWPNNALQLTSREQLPPKKWSDITITYDGSSKAAGIKIYLNGKAIALETKADNLYKNIGFIPDIHTYGFEGFTIGQRAKCETFLEGGIDKLQIYARELSALEVAFAQQSDRSSHNSIFTDDTLLEAHYHLHHDQAAQSTRAELLQSRQALGAHLDSISEIMVMGDLPQKRPTYLLERGMYDAHGKELQAGVPEHLLPFEEKWPQNRLGLSKWLFHPNHPLTARVFVNRIWAQHFGAGLVQTPDDFGNQGDLPSHPALLDWLAVSFVEMGWDIKQLHKLIVSSATYQQSSVRTPEKQQIDPMNRLLARGPSFRLSGEMIRDQALAVSGLLVDKLGGAGVYPYQPEGLWDEISNKHWRYRYLQEAGEGLYRRSLYTIWKRTSPPPSMLIFDAPDRSECIVKRNQTSTPLQALVLLNDPQFIEAARVLAINLLQSTPDNPAARLQQAFRLTTSRKASQTELETLSQFYQEELKRFAEKEEAAIQYLQTGTIQPDSSLDPIETAAFATVIHAIMNSAEASSRH